MESDCFMGYELSFGGAENVLELDRGDDDTIL